jgi:isopentenyl phosphate kinase
MSDLPPEQPPVAPEQPPVAPERPAEIDAGLQFLKLGGSLITDKNRPHRLRRNTLQRLATEIASACAQSPGLRLVLGHGSGSFGHVPARRYGTRQGVLTPEQWRGFGEVWREASALNRLVIEVLYAAGLRPISFPPSAAALAQAGAVLAWDPAPLRFALEKGLLPVVYGDVVFDTARGGTILSTEDLFLYLAKALRPQRVLVAGIEAGVWRDFPRRTQLVEEITPASYPGLALTLGGSASPDVTGGMASKVEQLLGMVRAVPGLEALIFSGETPGNVADALLGDAANGTRITGGKT